MVILCLAPFLAGAANFGAIGVTALRALDPALTGSNVNVVQPEGSVAANAWQVGPGTVGLPISLFTWISSSGSASTFPNSVGLESHHANNVANEFYGPQLGVAPGVAHVDSYEAGFFISRIRAQTSISGKIVNQSFGDPTDESLDTLCDNYAARYGTLFISGAGNGGPVLHPAACYNGMAVGAYGGASSAGPTSDGRSKPDITAPHDLTSFSTPQVAGAAAVLLQAANRNDGGPGTSSAAGDSRTLKALLMNGAEKPWDWTHSVSAPLDTRYGAGVLHLWNSYRQLRGGKQAFALSTSATTGSSHLPPSNTNNAPTRRGWDFNSLANNMNQETANHYFIDLRSASNRTFTLKATLVWQLHQNQTVINDLDLFLYDADTSNLVASSESLVDNVEHLYVTNLRPARYNLQVFKNGGDKRVTTSETYALVFEFGPPDEAQLVNAQFASGQFEATVTGEPNQNYAVDRTPDFQSWIPVVTNRTSGSGSFNFSHSDGADVGIFRARLVP